MKKSSIRVQWANECFVDEVFNVARQATEEVCVPRYPLHQQNRAAELLSSAFCRDGIYQALKNKYMETFVALDEQDRVVGTAISYEGEIMLHHVMPDKQNKGVGELLFNSMKQFARGGNMMVQVPIVLAAYYAKKGFVILRELKGSGGMLVIMRKDLSEEEMNTSIFDWVRICGLKLSA